MSTEFRIQAEVQSTTDDRIWQALQPSDFVRWAGPANRLAAWVAGNLNLTPGTTARVNVWTGDQVEPDAVWEFTADEQPLRDDQITLAWAVDDQLAHGTVNDLARCLQYAQLTGEEAPVAVYAPGCGQLVQLPITVTQDPFDSQNLALATVTVQLPGGRDLRGTWQIDGRV